MFAYILVFALTSLIFYHEFDEWLGTPLCERMQVQEKRYTLAGSRFNGKTHIPVAERWALRVANSNGESWVEVYKELYAKTSVGDTLNVTGTQGRFTRHWYLKKASKKR